MTDLSRKPVGFPKPEIEGEGHRYPTPAASLKLSRRGAGAILATVIMGLSSGFGWAASFAARRRFDDLQHLAATKGGPEPVWLQMPGHEGLFVYRKEIAADLAALPENLRLRQSIVVRSEQGEGGWVRQMDGSIRPEWFGAGGDDADATDALQATFDAIGSRGDKVVLSGRYSTSRRLVLAHKSGFSIVGPGQILARDDMPVGSGEPCVLFNACSGFEVADLTVDGNARGRGARATAAHAVEIRSCHAFAFRRLRVVNSVADCLYVAAAARDAHDRTKHSRAGSFEDCVFERGFRQGVTIIQGSDLRFLRCRFANSRGAPPQAGVDLESNPRDVAGAIHDVIFDSCVFEGSQGYGLLVASAHTPSRIVARQCMFRDNAAGAVSWNGRDGLLEDCVFAGFDGRTAVRGCIDVGARPSAGWLKILRPRIIDPRNQNSRCYFIYVHRIAGGHVSLEDARPGQLAYIAHFRAPACEVVGGEFEGAATAAVLLAAHAGAARGVMFLHSSGPPVRMSGDRCVVADCRFFDPLAQARGGAIEVLGGLNGAISRNLFRGFGSRSVAVRLSPKATATLELNEFR